ncbi:zinc finger CCCH domain-containing protein 14 [Sabethes cyaneus]|uniref:zinc finger CCCH domain-containing protein 14 n=1 Tax=Sabethes cyaneus TaxID=53552 RepID=UPI00237DD46F|nr:zinc finger CCCH domain-containing protein 14 [Sabethes cyaneus]
MDSLGSEIGQKMRSAVKAKLIELGTGSASGYIDDELPDYVMIMVANKRSRQQMVDDLQLFLGSQTEVFVSWLHQVLQKLEEVTLPVTAAASAGTSGGAGKNPKEGGKRKASDQKEKKDKKKDKKAKKQKEKSPEVVEEILTPPHPAPLGGSSIQEVFANQLIQNAKKTMEIEATAPKKVTRDITPPLREASNTRTENEFDIPTISEIAGQTALQKHQKELSELEEIQQRIKQAKKQLKAMGSDESEDEDFLNIKANDDDLENIEEGTFVKRKEKPKDCTLDINKEREKEKRSDTPPPPIPSVPPATKKKSIMERLGSRPDPKVPSADSNAETVANKANIISLSAHRREERELYVPVFRRKEMEEQAKARQARTTDRANRSRSRERDRRRSPVRSRSNRRDNSRDRSRSRREREKERELNRTRSSERGRDRDRERDRGREVDREHKRERDRYAADKVSNGTEIRSRIGSRVFVLPPKPEYVEEDELEVPILSVVKVQPRPQVPKNKQPSKNLLLKAMAEAQRSTAANLTKTISNREEAPRRHHRMLIEIPGAKIEPTPSVNVTYEEDDEEEVDIVNHVLGMDDDDDELQQILNDNDEYIPEPVAVSVSGRSDTDSDGYVYVPSKKLTSEQKAPELLTPEEYDPKDPAENPKFVVTLDGAYKKGSRVSPSHTPPPPPVAKPATTSKSKLSIKDRIGVKVSSEDKNKTPPTSRDDDDDRVHQETLKRRKERFSIKTTPSKERNSKRNSASRSPPQPQKRSKASSSSAKKSSPQKRTEKSSRSSNSHRKSSPSSSRDLNELLLQRTKELLVDDSVSSSPIYMSKTDYEKIEPNSSSRKRKRVSPIQFSLTDDEADDSDGEYNHHREREHRERKSVERPAATGMASGDEDSVGSRHQDQRKEREIERRRSNDDDRRKSSGNSAGAGAAGGGSSSGNATTTGAEPKSPAKKIKKLESSRKFDDIPQLLSSVSVPSDGLSKSKGIIKDRCKYFPLCRQGDSCEFLHPSTMCKAFPACKFGDKCLYLHPFCKFDKTCNRLDCTFMHTKPLPAHGMGSVGGPSAPPLASSVVPVSNYKTISAKPLPALCKFYPGCTNGLCPYYHPKMCRFGKHCMNKVECNFYHHELPGGVGDYHEVPPKDKFKWISPFTA